MKKIFNVTLLTVLTSASFVTTALDETWQAGVFGEYIKSATERKYNPDQEFLGSGKGFGIDLKKLINEQWTARIELAKTNYDIEDSADSIYGTRFGIDAIYNIDDSDFYLFTGIKRFDNVTNYNALNIGAGYSVEINERFALYSEAVVYRDVYNGYTDQGFKLGLQYHFGDVKKAPVVKKAANQAPVEKVMPLDTDNDGIIDANDRCENTAANVQVNSQGCAEFIEKEVTIDLHVPFEKNSAQVQATMNNDIHRLASFMKQYTNTSAVIEGHSSAVGNAKYNLILSQKRADAIKNVLISEHDIDASRLVAKGFGESKLISQGITAADHQLNRRVVAKVATMVKSVKQKN